VSQLSHSQYDALERAIIDGSRVAIMRGGTEFIVVPARLRSLGNREALDAKHPTTGENMTFYIDELSAIEFFR
jgi:hypothetical protein